MDNTELQKFYELVDDIEIAMMTTRRVDGHLRSRPMATQKRAEGADLWFVTALGTKKLAELEADPHVNLSYFNQKNMEWVSVSGLARISQDHVRIEELYQPDWKMWFNEESGAFDGSPEDPRITLIGVTLYAAEFMTQDESRPVAAFEFVKGWLTGTQPDIGQMHSIK